MLQSYAAVARAPFLLLPVTLVAAGTGVAFWEGGFHPAHALLALIGMVGLHVAVNAFNEVSDYRRGIDLETVATPFSGGSKTLPEGRLKPGAARAVALSGGAAGVAVGLYFLKAVGWPLVPILILGALAAFSYSDLLARLYLGEIFAGLGLGGLPVLGTVLVQTGGLSKAAIAASLPAFFMTLNLLLLNEFPDEEADRRGGRRNLVLLLGRRGAALVYLAAGLLTPLCLIAAVAFEVLPTTALAAVLPSLLLIRPGRWALRRPTEHPPIPALGANVIWNLATNTLLALAMLTAGLLRG